VSAFGRCHTELTKGSVFVTLRQIVQFENYNSITALCSAHLNQKRLPILKENKIYALKWSSFSLPVVFIASLALKVGTLGNGYTDYRRESFFYVFLRGRQKTLFSLVRKM
jgi:hypothetical protein